MALESATYINQLVAANPLSTDNESQGANHLQLIKSVLQNTFPNIAGAATATDADLSALKGAATIGASIKVVTQPTSDNSTNAASTAFVLQVAFSTALPAQSGQPVGSYLTTNGASASWVPINANDISLIAQGII